ncbi:MAG: cyclic nucleotide-binding domain-containing protein [Pseudomonadota bacterium]
MSAFEFVFSPEFLVYAAGACYVLGLLIINQVVLRLLILTGTAFYLVYYATVAATPLWEAIYISLLIALSNVYGLASLLARQSHLAIPRAHQDIYGHFPGLPPGDFRTLMRYGKRRVTDTDLPLTHEGTPLTKMYYIIDGDMLVMKGGDQFRVPPGVFVGEVAYLTGQRASASTRLRAGSEYIEWNAVDLRTASARSLRFKMALEASLSQDLAHKVARSVAPDDPVWRPHLTVVPPQLSSLSSPKV